jgi:hypothetical protein
MRRALLLVFLLAGSAPAFAQQPSASYTVTVESPGSVALGSISLRVRVSGGVREAEFAAYHLRTAGGWSEAQSLKLPRVGENLFEQPIDTTSLPNDAYRIEVRVWSDVPPYDHTDPKTYSRSIVDLAVDNPPPAPTGLEAVSPATSLRVGWQAVETADRSDFLGYRVHLRKGKTCPAALASYREVDQVEGLIFVDEKPAAGDYCVRVTAARRSAVSETILSAPSKAVKVSISKGNDPIVRGSGIVFDSTDSADPPPPPPLGDGEAIISDGEFVEDLPYGSATITQEAQGPNASGEEISREAGVDPRRTPTLIATGLILATMAGLLRRFLRGVPAT